MVLFSSTGGLWRLVVETGLNAAVDAFCATFALAASLAFACNTERLGVGRTPRLQAAARQPKLRAHQIALQSLSS